MCFVFGFGRVFPADPVLGLFRFLRFSDVFSSDFVVVVVRFVAGTVETRRMAPVSAGSVRLSAAARGLHAPPPATARGPHARPCERRKFWTFSWDFSGYFS